MWKRERENGLTWRQASAAALGTSSERGSAPPEPEAASRPWRAGSRPPSSSSPSPKLWVSRMRTFSRSPERKISLFGLLSCGSLAILSPNSEQNLKSQSLSISLWHKAWTCRTHLWKQAEAQVRLNKKLSSCTCTLQGDNYLWSSRDDQTRFSTGQLSGWWTKHSLQVGRLGCVVFRIPMVEVHDFGGTDEPCEHECCRRIEQTAPANTPQQLPEQPIIGVVMWMHQLVWWIWPHWLVWWIWPFDSSSLRLLTKSLCRTTSSKQQSDKSSRRWKKFSRTNLGTRSLEDLCCHVGHGHGGAQLYGSHAIPWRRHHLTLLLTTRHQLRHGDGRHLAL